MVSLTIIFALIFLPCLALYRKMPLSFFSFLIEFSMNHATKHLLIVKYLVLQPETQLVELQLSAKNQFLQISVYRTLMCHRAGLFNRSLNCFCTHNVFLQAFIKSKGRLISIGCCALVRCANLITFEGPLAHISVVHIKGVIRVTNL